MSDKINDFFGDDDDEQEFDAVSSFFGDDEGVGGEASVADFFSDDVEAAPVAAPVEAPVADTGLVPTTATRVQGDFLKKAAGSATQGAADLLEMGGRIGEQIPGLRALPFDELSISAAKRLGKVADRIKGSATATGNEKADLVKKKVADAEGFVGTMGAMVGGLSNPDYAADVGGDLVGSMALPFGIGRAGKAMKAGLGTTTLAIAAAEGGMAGGAQAAEIEKKIMELDDSTLDNSPEFLRLEAENGGDREAAKAVLARGTAAGTGAATGILSAMVSKIPGMNKLDEIFAGAKIANAAPGRALTGAVSEGSQEVAQAVAETATGNRGMNYAGEENEILAGVEKKAAEALVLGGLAGGAVGTLGGQGGKPEDIGEAERLADEAEEARIVAEEAAAEAAAEGDMETAAELSAYVQKAATESKRAADHLVAERAFAAEQATELEANDARLAADAAGRDLNTVEDSVGNASAKDFATSGTAPSSVSGTTLDLPERLSAFPESEAFDGDAVAEFGRDLEKAATIDFDALFAKIEGPTTPAPKAAGEIEGTDAEKETAVAESKAERSTISAARRQQGRDISTAEAVVGAPIVDAKTLDASTPEQRAYRKRVQAEQRKTLDGVKERVQARDAEVDFRATESVSSATLDTPDEAGLETGDGVAVDSVKAEADLADGPDAVGLDPRDIDQSGEVAVTDADLDGMMEAAKSGESVDAPLPTTAARIKAFHGSGSLFDRFDMSKLNSGEGAQVFGHGLYFTSRKEIAQWYKESVSGAVERRPNINGKPLTGIAETPETKVAGTMLQSLLSHGDEKATRKRLESIIARENEKLAKPAGALSEAEVTRASDNAKSAQQALDMVAVDGSVTYDNTSTPSLYDVDLDVEEGDLLDWDMDLLDADPAEIDRLHDALKDLDPEQEYDLKDQISMFNVTEFSGLYEELRYMAGGAKEVSDHLLSKGYRGIKYAADRNSGARLDADGNEMDKGQNYVIFDDSLVTINSVARIDTSKLPSREPASAPVKKVLDRMVNDTVKVADTYADLPDDVRADIEDQFGEAAIGLTAVADRKGGKVYIVGDTVTDPDDVRPLVAHELSHLTRESVLPLLPLHKAIGGDAGVKAFAEKWGIDMEPYLEANGTMGEMNRRAMLIDELIAQTDERMTGGESLVSEIKAAKNRLVAHVRAKVPGFAEKGEREVLNEVLRGRAMAREKFGGAAYAMTPMNQRIATAVDASTKVFGGDARAAAAIRLGPQRPNGSAKLGIRSKTYRATDKNWLDDSIRIKDAKAKFDKVWIRAFGRTKALGASADTAKGKRELGSKVMDARDRSEGRKSMHTTKSEKVAYALDRVVAQSGGSKAGRADLTDRVAAYIGGDKSVKLPERVRTVADLMRAHLDERSTQVLAMLDRRIDDMGKRLSDEEWAEWQTYLDTDGESGNIPTALSSTLRTRTTVAENMGGYLHRSYRVFNELAWQKKAMKDEALVAAAMAETGNTRAELFDMLDAATREGDMTAFVSSGSRYGSKDVSSLKRRKTDDELGPALRALLGENTDPRVNYLNSIQKMSSLIEGDAFLTEIRDTLAGTVIFDELNDDKELATIAPKGSETYSPLNGLKAHPDAITALSSFQAAAKDGSLTSILGEVFVRGNGYVKLGKTVYSPATHIANVGSQMLLGVMRGHINPFTPEGYANIQMAVEMMAVDLFANVENDTPRRAQMRKDYERMIELGIAQDGAFAGEARDLESDAGIRSTGKGVGSKALRLSQNAYEWEDSLFKIIAFKHERDILTKRGVPLEEAELQAAQRIRDTYPTYSKVPEGVKDLRRFPLVGAFVSFQSEMIRTTANEAKYLKADIEQGRGASRLTSLAVGSAIVPMIAALMAEAAGMGDEEEEAAREMLPSFMNNSTIGYLGPDDNGVQRLVDLGRFDPYNFVSSMYRAAERGGEERTPLRRGVEVGVALLEPFLSYDITAGAVADVINNTRSVGGPPVYNPESEWHDIAADIATHVGKSLEPTLTAGVRKTADALYHEKIKGEPAIDRYGRRLDSKAEAAATFLARSYAINPATATLYNGKEFIERKRNAVKILGDVVGNQSSSTTDDDVVQAVHAMQKARGLVYATATEQVTAAKAFGMDDGDIRQRLRGAGLGSRDIYALLKGEAAPEWRPSSEFREFALEVATAQLGPDNEGNREEYREMRRKFVDRRRLVFDTLRDMEKEARDARAD